MKRLAIALSVLLSLNLITLGMRWLILSGFLPLTQLWLPILIGIGIVVLTYFATLEASPFYNVYAREAKLYVAAVIAGILLGLI
jgi:hypothetical protein